MDNLSKLYFYNAKVLSVYDGDTITVEVDLGFHIKHEIKLRLLGINAPELRGVTKEKGIIVRDYLITLILNKEITIETFKFKKGEIW